MSHALLASEAGTISCHFNISEGEWALSYKWGKFLYSKGHQMLKQLQFHIPNNTCKFFKSLVKITLKNSLNHPVVRPCTDMSDFSKFNGASK